MPDSDLLELGMEEPVEKEGHETLLPSVRRSVLSGKSMVDVRLPDPPQALVSEPRDKDKATRGARSGDLIGGRYVVEGQLGRGGMGRVMRVRHSSLGKPFALKLIKTAIATNPKIRELF